MDKKNLIAEEELLDKVSGGTSEDDEENTRNLTPAYATVAKPIPGGNADIFNGQTAPANIFNK